MDSIPKQHDKILLAHGGGGRLMAGLIEKIILPKFSDGSADKLTDAASLELSSSSVYFTTDSFVVQPIFFNGGDIGKLAVCGTVNDIAVMGAKPVALSLALIIEEGFEISQLERILASVADTTRDADVSVVTGDTKVVEAGAADGIFINTAAIGVRLGDTDIGFDRIKPGDKLIINGTLGDHGMTIMSRRKGIKFDSPLKSDCAPLGGLICEILESTGGVKFMRDPTRGGLAATLSEIATATGHDIEIVEESLPINPTVRAAAEMLGFDILNIANEGKVLIVASAENAEKVLDACRRHPLGAYAAIIGQVTGGESDGQPDGEPNGQPGTVELITKIGGRRIVQMPYGRELPRIC